MFVGWVGLFQKASITCWSSGERVAGAFALVFLVALLGGIFLLNNIWNMKIGIEKHLVKTDGM